MSDTRQARRDLWGGATWPVLLVVVVPLALAGCRAEEQGRPLDFKPGVYRGERLDPLSRERLRELRARGDLMR